MYSKILVPLDGSQLAECVLPYLKSIVTGCGVAEVTLLRVVEPFRMLASEDIVLTDDFVREVESQSNREALDYLERLKGQMKYDGTTVKAVVACGRAADSIADYATKNGMDLIVIATHGRSGVSRWFLGSVADRIVRSACVPVLMVRAPGCGPIA